MPAHRLLPPDVGSMEDVEEPHTHDRDPAPSLVAVTHFFPNQHRSPRDISLLADAMRANMRKVIPTPSLVVYICRPGGS
jgi:hypothetical protein